MSSKKIDEKWWKISKEEEYKNNGVLKQSDVKIIQDWLKKRPYLPILNDNQIIMFLRASDFSLEQTKILIELNYTMRTKLPEFFAHRNLNSKAMEYVKEWFQLSIFQPTNYDDIVVISKIKEVDLAKFNFEECIKLCFMVHDMSHMEFGSSNGYIYIVDMQNFTLGLLLRMQITLFSSMLKFWQDCSTYRIKEIHIINGGQIFKKLLQVIQPFLNADISDVIQVHDDFASLKKSLNVKLIPKDYEGTEITVEELNKKTIKTLAEYNEWFIIEEKQRVTDKSKLHGNATAKVGEMQGSFRKLDLD